MVKAPARSAFILGFLAVAVGGLTAPCAAHQEQEPNQNQEPTAASRVQVQGGEPLDKEQRFLRHEQPWRQQQLQLPQFQQHQRQQVLQQHHTAQAADQLLQAVVHKLANQEEEPIVINSVHTGTTSYNRRPSHNQTITRQPPRSTHSTHNTYGAATLYPADSRQQPHTNHTKPVSAPGGLLSPADSIQDTRSAAAGLHQPHAAPSLQPSQEFDSYAAARNPAGLLTTASQQTATGQRWPFARPQQQFPAGGMAAGAQAPYAIQQSSGAAPWLSLQDGKAALPERQPSRQYTLIRDTSQLAGQQTDRPQYAAANYSGAAPGDHWVQYVRDNHHGPLRSRFNITFGSSAFYTSGEAALALRAPTTDAQSEPAASTPDPADSLAGSRRNSKFTRQREPLSSTTPLPSSAAAAAASPAAPKNQTIAEAAASSEENLSGAAAEPDSESTVSAPFEASQQQQQQTLAIVNGSGAATLPQARPSPGPFLISNNHSSSKRNKTKQARNLFSLAEHQISEESSFRAKSEPAGELASQSKESSAQTARASGWPMRLLRRTLTGVLKRLVGQQSGDTAQQSSGNNLGAQHSSKSPLVAQALAAASMIQSISTAGAAAANGMVADPSNVAFAGAATPDSAAVSGLSGFPGPALSLHHHNHRPQKGPLMEQLEQLAGSGGKALLASSNSLVQETIGQTLRQHANKKIIDSLVDLPVSERRQATVLAPVERRQDDSSAGEQSSLVVTNETKFPVNRTARSLGAAALYATPSLELQSAFSAADDETEGGGVGATEEDYNGNEANEYRSLDLSSDDEDSIEALDTSLSLDGDSVVAPDDEEPARYYLYSSHPSLSPLSARNLEESEESQLEALARRRYVGPASSGGGAGDTELSESLLPAEDRRISLRRRRRPRPPSSHAGAAQLLRPGGLLSQVPAISLQSAKAKVTRAPNVVHSTSTSASTSTSTSTSTSSTTSTVAAPASRRPHKTAGKSNSAGLMSPLSSSINVMDLDPSQTQLAHNKLIVAKYKPSHKGSHARPGTRTRAKPAAQTQAHGEPLSGSRRSQPSSLHLGSHLPSQQQQQQLKRPAAHQQTGTDLTGTVLGGQAITESHIKDVINRWTRLGSASPASAPSPSSSSAAAAAAAPAQRAPAEEPTAELGGRTGSGQPVEPWNITSSSRTNYSLLSINNRERINPLVLPIEHLPDRLAQLPKLGGPAGAQSQRHKQHGLRNRASSTTSTSTTTTSTTSTSTTSTTRRPSRSPSLPGDDELGGQTVRSQHHNRLKRPAVVRVKQGSEAERLRNQLLSLTGTLLDGRHDVSELLMAHKMSGLNESGFLGSSGLSGHISIVPAELQSKLGAKEAAVEANKYSTPELEADWSRRREQQEGPAVEHSILVLKDNHNQRAGGARPPPPPPVQQLVNKYLDELVNGSRIRPSSAMNLAGSGASDAGWQAKSALTLTTNHSPSLEGLIQRRFGAPVSGMSSRPQQQQPQVSQGAGARPSGELDLKAQELLRDVFDRDPSYSASFFGYPAGNRLASRSQDGGHLELSPVRPPSEAGADGQDSATSPASEPQSYSATSELASEPSPATATEPSAEPSSTVTASTAVTVSGAAPALEDSVPSSERDTPPGAALDLVGHRASLKRHQAALVALLGAIAAKRRQNQTSPSAGEEPASVVELHELAGSTESELVAAPGGPASSVSPDYQEQAAQQTTAPEASEPARVAHTQATPAAAAAGAALSETTRYYSPVESAADRSSGVSRYPLSVETVSGQRQKINRPSTPSGLQDYGQPMGVTSLPVSKLTESPTNDESLRQTIQNRLGQAQAVGQQTSTLLPGALVAELEDGEPYAEPAAAPSKGSAADGEPVIVDSVEPNEQLAAGAPDSYPLAGVDPVLAEFAAAAAAAAAARPPSQTHFRPVIIRRRPAPQRLEPQYLVLAGAAPPSKKRRKRPQAKPRPTAQVDSVEPVEPGYTLSELLGSGEQPAEQLASRPGYTVLHDSGNATSLRRRRPALVLERPTIIRKNPNQRRPIMKAPAAIRITGPRPLVKPPASLSIILPVDSLVERPAQDIRTAPLTIMDPATESPGGLDGAPGLGHSGAGFFAKLPETTILHDKIMVSYKPGRPRPSASTSAPPAATFALGGPTKSTPMPGAATTSGGDSHLVSILEQASSSGGGASRAPSSTQQPPGHSRPGTMSGSFNSNALHNSSVTAVDNHRPPPTSGAHPNGTRAAAATGHKATASGDSSALEAGSLSVLAQASQGNHSRPWFPGMPSSAGAASLASNQRHNATSGNSTASDELGASGSLSAVSVSGDAMLASESAGAGGSGSGSPSSGSYSNHHQQQQTQQSSQLGMPFLGGSLSLISRPQSAGQPGSGRPYRWRVRRKPAPGQDHSGSGSSSSYVYRPAAPPDSLIMQLFSSAGLGGFYENLRLFMARLRTVLISLMVMFLPPLALAASVANVMSN